MTGPSDDGQAGVTVTEFGEVLISQHYDHATGRERIRIERADPRVRVALELLDRITEGECQPWATVGGEELDVVTLADDYGQRFIYRLGNFDPLHDAFEMEWPD